jgi:hypothetical protein
MTIEIPDDLARELTRLAAAQRKSVVEVALDWLRPGTKPADSPQAILEMLRRLPHPSPAAVDDLEAAIAAAQLPVSDRDPFERRSER